MPVNIEGLLETVAVLCENKKLRACAVQNLRGGLLTGLSAVAGGLLLGPLGLAIGGTMGGIASAVASSGKFVPVCTVLRNMKSSEKTLLYSKLKKAFENVGIEDVATIAVLIMSQTNYQEIAIREVGQFLSQEMSLQIK